MTGAELVKNLMSSNIHTLYDFLSIFYVDKNSGQHDDSWSILCNTQWVICSTPHALSPNALSPRTLSPHAPTPHTLSTDGLSEKLSYSEKLLIKFGLLDVVWCQKWLTIIKSYLRSPWFFNIFISPSGLRTQGLRARGLWVWGLRASGLRARVVEHTTHRHGCG